MGRSTTEGVTAARSPFPVCLIILTLLACPSPSLGQYSVTRQDPFALLSATLSTRQTAACDGQELTLECPQGTKISIQLVEYGRRATSEKVCPPTSVYPKAYLGTEGLDCSFPEALKHIEAKCHGQELCSMTVAPEAFGGGRASSLYFRDPCQGYRKYVEVAYQCKPTEFKSRVVCHSDTLTLECQADRAGDDKRIAIYSSAFASALGSHVYCPSAADYDNDGGGDGDANGGLFGAVSSKYEGRRRSAVDACKKSPATEAVMEICHGKKSCSITAAGSALGAPACNARLGVYLKTVFACVSKTVLKPHFHNDVVLTTTVTSSTPDEHNVPTFSPETVEIEMMGDLSSINDQLGRHDEMFSPKQERTASQDGEASGKTKDDDGSMMVGFVSDVVSSYNHIRKHKEKFILFASLSVALGLTLFLAMVLWGVYRSSRLSRLKARVPRPSSGNAATNNIDAYFSSPASSPTRAPPPDGAVDIELEVGDHEVDSAFRRAAAPDPLVVAPLALQRGSPTYNSSTLPRNGTLRRYQHHHPHRDSFCMAPPPPLTSSPSFCDSHHGTCVATVEIPPPLILPSMEERQPLCASPYRLEDTILSSPTAAAAPAADLGSPATPPAVNWVGSTAGPAGGILRNSQRDSPSISGSDCGGSVPKTVRYSTLGGPRHGGALASPTFEEPPKSLTLSRVSNADHLLYG